eukprot:TRINITY_DN27420_c0_g1_i1.p1 TRINITY_DN27420_c0_g1~~TRINITY_DN27420_c0_g1_i1.p1  ORF type:complete len:729 (-),score=126.08 TRINITY_DN27420_c0_g1_i1:617-2803(-)
MRDKKSSTWTAYVQGFACACFILCCIQYLHPIPGGDAEPSASSPEAAQEGHVRRFRGEWEEVQKEIIQEEVKEKFEQASSRAGSQVSQPAKQPGHPPPEAPREASPDAEADVPSLVSTRKDLINWISNVATFQEVDALKALRSSLIRGRDPVTATRDINDFMKDGRWTFCVMEGDVCECPSGITRYGDPDKKKWKERSNKKSPVLCHVTQYGLKPEEDISPGMIKTCQCMLKFSTCSDGRAINTKKCPGTGLSPCRAGCFPHGMVTSKNKLSKASLCRHNVPYEMLMSCDHKAGLRPPKKDHKDSKPQEILDLSTHELCKDHWLAAEMEVYLECDFHENFLKWTSEKSPWIEEAYVTYVGGAKDSKFEWQCTNLIRSIDLFSTRPLVIVIFGEDFVPPTSWQTFPNIVVFRMRGISRGVSFNFNKVRAMIGSRVLTAIQLDTDQLIFKGMDQVFEATKREVTEHYPWPILPVHWMSRDETPGNPYRHYAFKGWDGPQTMRWNHAHPTWTYWALPFLGDMMQERMAAATGRQVHIKVWDLELTRSDKTLFQILKLGEKAKAKRLAEMTNFMWEDEDMFNVNLWKHKVTKTWCKFDLEPALYTFRRGMNDNIYFDPKWYPDGLPILFLSMHNTKNTIPTDWLLKVLEICKDGRKELDCPPPDQNVLQMCRIGRPEERKIRESIEEFGNQVCCCMQPRWEYPVFWGGKWYRTLKEVPKALRSGKERQCIMP